MLSSLTLMQLLWMKGVVVVAELPFQHAVDDGRPNSDEKFVWP